MIQKPHIKPSVNIYHQDLSELNNLIQNQSDQLKHTYSLLQESEEKFRVAFKTSPDSINLNRLSDGLYIEINEGFTQLTGYTWKDVEGKTSSDINIWYEPVDRQRMVSAIRETGKVYNFETKFRLKDGRIRTGLMSASVFKYKNEDFVLSVTRDIEELVQARALLRESDERFRQFADHIDDVIWISEGNQVLYLNAAIKRKFGYDATTFISNIDHVSTIIVPEDFPIYEELYAAKFSTNTNPVIRQLRIYDSEGKIHWVWVRLFPILNDVQAIYRVAGIASDITVLKEFENDLLSAKEKAQESDKLKSAFLANLSHEIRTPMNGIMGFSGLLVREAPKNSTFDHYVEIINKCNEQLLHIIDDLVDISKIEANQMMLVDHECNIEAMFDDLFVLYTQELVKMDKKSVQLIKQYEPLPEDKLILTDEFRLRQVLMNLLNNAVKFTREGHILFGFERLSGERIRFFVEDTGIGIAESETENIFKPFRQIDITSTKIYGGTGLGLSICRGLVKLMGGTIRVESKPGKGSTFGFEIPYRLPDHFRNQGSKSKVKDEPLHFNDKTVLVVEDDDMNYAFLYEVFITTGLKIIRASNGAEAVEKAVSMNPDLIIMDIRLPIMNGLDATREIRIKGIRTPIIAQTAYAMSEDKEICFAAGCDDYISKPIHKELLLKKAAYHLHRNAISGSR